MNIMYAADDNYAEIMGVSVKSLIENNSDEKLMFYIITDKMGRDNINHLREMIETSGNKVEFIGYTQYGWGRFKDFALE